MGICSPEFKCRHCYSIRTGVSHFSSFQYPNYKLGGKVSAPLPSRCSCENWNEAAFMHQISMYIASTSNKPRGERRASTEASVSLPVNRRGYPRWLHFSSRPDILASMTAQPPSGRRWTSPPCRFYLHSMLRIYDQYFQNMGNR